MSEFGRLLPSEFIPQLREQTPTIKIDGGFKDYELPDISDLSDDTSSSSWSGSLDSPADPELRARMAELQKEQSLLKEEHKGNLRDLNSKLEAFELQVKFKNDKISEL